MKTISRFPNISGATGAPLVSISEAGAGLISEGQDWRLMLDPDVSPAGVPFNRANGLPTVPTSAVPRGLFANGAASFELGANYQVQPNIAFPTEEWSMFWVCRLSSVIAGQLARSLSAFEATGVLTPRLSFSNTALGFYVYDGFDAGTVVVATNGDTWVDETAYFMATFSTDGGSKMYVNGVLVDDEPTKTTVFEQGTGAGEWQMFNAMRGKVGICGLLANDLSRETHAVGRRKIDDYLMDKYGI